MWNIKLLLRDMVDNYINLEERMFVHERTLAERDPDFSRKYVELQYHDV